MGKWKKILAKMSISTRSGQGSRRSTTPHSSMASTLFGVAFKEGELPASMCKALIVVLPKPEKDKLLCGSYHLISLLNSEMKALAKLLAIRLQKVIHPDQTGFMPGNSTYNNIDHLYLHIQKAATDQKSGLVLSLDVLKAFGKLCIAWASTPNLSNGSVCAT